MEVDEGSPAWRTYASGSLNRIIEHGDDYGDIANLAGDDLRDVVVVAVEEIRRLRSETATS